MHEFASKFQHLITTQRLQSYWPQFNAVAYAIYNDNEVLLFNHPKCKDSDYITFPKTDEFNACTIILFEDFPTAIVDVRLSPQFNEMYAIIIHELFHGYQYTYGESRFPNELVGIDYSLSEKNISLRIEEQIALHQALQTKELSSLHYFIALRNTRTSLFPDETGYEAAIETIEGPAHYIETRAFKDVSSDSYKQYITKTLNLLIDPIESHLHIRKSCYSSGLALCMLLDYYSPNWQQSFTESKVSLFEFFESLFKNNDLTITIADHSQTVEMIRQKDKQLRQAKFEQFQQSTGYKVVIKGTFKVTTFDPMNITKYNNQALHHNFIKLSANGLSYTFTQPVHTTFEQNFMTIFQMELFLKAPPIIESGTIIITNYQLPIRQLEEINHVYYVTL